MRPNQRHDNYLLIHKPDGDCVLCPFNVPGGDCKASASWRKCTQYEADENGDKKAIFYIYQEINELNVNTKTL